HCKLWWVLHNQGRFADALAAVKRGHELGSRMSGWGWPSAVWVREAEQMVQLAGRLPAVLAGKDQPRDTAERMRFAHICQIQQRYAASAHFYKEAFAQEPVVAANL